MEISMTSLKALRERTGAGIMDCKRALEGSAGDFEVAAAALKKLSEEQAQKREDREAREGRVFVRTTEGRSVIVNIACETDFVARNEDFIKLGADCLDAAFASGEGDHRAEMEGLIGAAAMRIREKIALRGMKALRAGADETLRSYVHGEGRIGVTVRLRSSGQAVFSLPEIRELASDLALHAAAFAPAFLSRSDVDPEFIEAKKAEYENEVRASGKKDSMVAGIVRGKQDKLLKKLCFLDQAFIKDESKTVGEAIAMAGRAAGQAVELSGYVYEGVATLQA
jgi:elongation factor Ts